MACRQLYNPVYSKAERYAQLMPDSISNNPNQQWLACMIASWWTGEGVLPDYLGLASQDFNALKACYFSWAYLPTQAPSGSRLDFSRMSEKQDLTDLLKRYSRPHVLETNWIADIIVAGCLGADHLWQDLGLWSRAQLTDLLRYNFPELAAKNVHDMKWKKFLYKQLCEAEGLYLCRAPSCQVCADYEQCYGSEEPQNSVQRLHAVKISG